MITATDTTTHEDGSQTVKVRTTRPAGVRPFYFDRCAPTYPFGTDTRVTAGVVYATDEAAAREQFRSVFGKEIAEVDKRYRFLDLATVTDRPHGNVAVVTVRDRA